MKNYRIDFGDANEGPLGAVAFITASSEKGALAKFRRQIGKKGHEIPFEDLGDTDNAFVYFNPAKVTLKHVKLDE